MDDGGGVLEVNARSWKYDLIGFRRDPHPLPSPACAGEGELAIRRYYCWRLTQPT